MKASFARWGLINPVHFLRGERVPFLISEILQVEGLSIGELRGYQERKLAKLFRDCCKRDPYYRQVLEPITSFNNVDYPFDFFEQLPFLTKQIVIREEINRPHYVWKRLDHRSTSGSTGTPFSFYKDRLATGYMEAVQNCAYGWYDLCVGAPQGRFWGMPMGKQAYLSRLKDFIKNRVRFSAFNLSNKAKEDFFSRLMQFNPEFFYGYPSLMLEFARYIGRERFEMAGLPLKVIIGTGEYITSDEKQELAQLVGVPFAGEYGCTETGVIGFDCVFCKMHLMASNIYLEVVDSDGIPVETGVEGEFIVTELNSTHSPFIRYRLGDRGRFTGETCDCGRSLPVIEISAGRRDDYIHTPEGGKVYDAILAYTLKKGVLQFQAIQDRIDHLHVYIVSDGHFTMLLKEKYITDLQKKISPCMNIDISTVSEIAREPSGKLRYFKSEIRGDSVV